MRAFHMSWIAFFLCFFAWFGIAPLMAVVRDEMQLTKDQVGWCIIGSVAITIVARLVVGWLCDRYRPAADLHVAAVARFASGDGDRARPRLHDVSAVSRVDRRDRGVVRHHAVSHVADVRAELRRHRQRHDRRLGQSGRRRHAVRDAAAVRAVCRRARSFGRRQLAAGDGRRRPDVRARPASPTTSSRRTRRKAISASCELPES